MGHLLSWRSMGDLSLLTYAGPDCLQKDTLLEGLSSAAPPDRAASVPVQLSIFGDPFGKAIPSAEKHLRACMYASYIHNRADKPVAFTVWARMPSLCWHCTAT